MYYVNMHISYESCNFKFEKWNNEIRSLLEDVFNSDGLHVHMVVRGELIEHDSMIFEANDLNDWLCRYEERYLDIVVNNDVGRVYEQELQKILRLRNLLNISTLK